MTNTKVRIRNSEYLRIPEVQVQNAECKPRIMTAMANIFSTMLHNGTLQTNVWQPRNQWGLHPFFYIWMLYACHTHGIHLKLYCFICPHIIHTQSPIYLSHRISHSPSDMSVLLLTHNIFVGSEPGHQTLNTLQYMIFKQLSTVVINNFKHELSDYNNV